MSRGQRMPAAALRASLPDVVQDVRRKGQRVRITRYGKTVAVIVPVEDADVLESCKEELDACRARASAKAAPVPPRRRRSKTA